MVPPVTHTNLTISFPGCLAGFTGLLSRVVFWVTGHGEIKRPPLRSTEFGGGARIPQPKQVLAPEEKRENSEHFRIVVPLMRSADMAGVLKQLAPLRHRKGLEVELFSENGPPALSQATRSLRERLTDLGISCRSAHASGAIDFSIEMSNFAQWVQADLILCLSDPNEKENNRRGPNPFPGSSSARWPEKLITLSSPLLSPP